MKIFEAARGSGFMMCPAPFASSTYPSPPPPPPEDLNDRYLEAAPAGATEPSDKNTYSNKKTRRKNRVKEGNEIQD